MKDVQTWLVSDDSVAHVILFTSKKKVPPIMKALSMEFHGRAAIGIVPVDSKPEIAHAFDIRSRPTLLHVMDEDFKIEPFEREFQKDDLELFLSRVVMKHRADAKSA